MTEARRGNKVEVVATAQQAKQLRSLGLKTDRKTTGGVSQRMARAQRATDHGTSSARTSTTTRRPRSTMTAPAARARRSTRSCTTWPSSTEDARQARSSATTINGKPSSRSRSPRMRARPATGSAPRPLLLDAARARVARAPRHSAASLHLFVENYGGTGPAGTRTATRSPARRRKRSPSSSTRTSCGSSRSPTLTATTTRSRPATGCGARTCATTTATGRSRPATASTRTATSRRTGTTTTRAPRATPRARPTAARARRPSPRRGRWTACSSGIGFEIHVNYHSAAQLLLYPIGFQVETYTADDPIYRARRAPTTTRRSRATAMPEPTTRTSAPSSTPPTARRPTTRTAVRHAGVDAGARRGGRRPRRWRQRLRVPGRRGRHPGGVREEHPVRARRGQVRARSREPGLAPRQRRGRLRARRRSASPTATRRTSQVDAKRELGTSRCTSGSTAARADRTDDGMEGRRALRRRLRPLLPPPSRPRDRHQAGRQGEVWFKAGGKSRRLFTYTGGAGARNKVLITGRGGLHRPQPDHAPTDRAELPGVLQHALRPTASATTSRTSTRRTARRRDRARRAQPLQGGHLVHGRRLFIRDAGRAGRQRHVAARRTTRSSTSATTSTRAASCSTPGKNAADGQLDRVLVQPGRPAAVLQPASTRARRIPRALRGAQRRLPPVLAGGVRPHRRRERQRRGQRHEPVQRWRSVRR